MNIIELPITELKPYKNNPKKHSQKQIDLIAQSIELTKGLRQPIVIDKDKCIVCGHGRYMAAQKLGYETVPCELIDNLTEDQIKAYRLIDNRISSNEYDADLEFIELSDIELDMSAFEFEAFSIDDIEEPDAYNVKQDEREYFEKVFTFPVDKKKQITCYLKKHYDEVIQRIIDEAAVSE